ncbi:hypothetical protein F2Q70_00042626 [Brassica cretica]|uniref:Uncharacterized protein n=1 Tax=Brassica cretica TaxID=69181 RepID=A0A8S9KFZ7_BRACR|nr:hypothetical protein F2Q70_00042626 [Brassica cretica]
MSQFLFPVSHTIDSEFNIVVDELGEAPPPKPSVKASQFLFPVSHTIDSEFNIVVDELSEGALVRARHNPPDM